MNFRFPPLLKTFILVLCGMAVLSSCGFKLRGVYQLAPEMQNLKLSASITPTTRESVKQALTANRVTILNSLEQGQYQLNISNEKQTQRTLTVSGNAKSAELELGHQFSFSLSNANGAVVYGPYEVIGQRTFLEDPSNPIGKREEARLIRENLRRDIINQLMRRLQSVKSSTLAKLEKELAESKSPQASPQN